MHVHGFPPIASPDARVLVLGTMPGVASLQAKQYFAHPKNAFWRIAGEVLGFDAGAPYEARASSLMAAGIALWDVLQSCTRPGSLDADIADGVPNDFATFFAAHPGVRRVCFNGAKAEALYAQHVRPRVPGPPACEYLRLPSTSPANAGVSLADKLRAWQAIGRSA
jgi:TDG/mug DNA glycosylase family protein